MNKNRMICAGVITLLFTAGAVFGQLSEGAKDTLFIGSMKIQPSVEQLAAREGTALELQRAAQSLETQFINAVSATRVFQLVDRKRIADLQLEQSFAAVSVNPNDKNAARALQMSGARYAFLPEIDGFQVRTDTDQYAVGRESVTRRYYLSALVQIVDTTTGELLPDVPSVELNEIETTEMAAIGQAQASDQVIVTLSKKMANRLSQEVIALLRPAKILTVTGTQVMINRGAEAGFVPGVPVEIYAYQNVVDPDSGETFRNEVPVGKAMIQRGDNQKSFAELVGEDLGVVPGCIVKAVRGASKPQVIEPATWSGGKEDVGTETAPRQVSPETPGSSEKPMAW